MATHTKANGRMAWPTVMVPSSTLKVRHMKENGKTTFSTVMAVRHGARER